jgi:peptidoglycan/xylan/chitin deacetylase (PgdA/CDA1 family)
MSARAFSKCLADVFREASIRLRGWPRVVFPLVVSVAPIAPAIASACDKPVYLTFDTGGMQRAEWIAQLLRDQQIKATFFIANEKTFQGDMVLDERWIGFWQALAKDGHAFGSHTMRHGRILAAQGDAIRYRPQFGQDSGKTLLMTPETFCGELRSVEERFFQMTQRGFDAIWRAPGGYTTPNAIAAATQCGYRHVGWSPAGFLGDELPSDRYPNKMLLQKALRDIRSGDILMAHLGIWSRQEVYAPMLEPLIVGLKEKGFCFRTIPQHPHYQNKR